MPVSFRQVYRELELLLDLETSYAVPLALRTSCRRQFAFGTHAESV